jgi:putative flippase GtrA
LLRQLVEDRVTLRLIAVYLLIGGSSYVLYILLFSVLRQHAPLPLAISVAYFTATAMHFTLNRYVNFRRFDRAVHDQARTFVAVIAVQWLTTVVIVNLLTVHGVQPAIAATVAVVVNLPLGFVANRYLTFGVGIVPRVLGLRKAEK